MSVLYTPGNEPENIKNKLQKFFEKLDSAYPDKIVKGLHKDHKKWGEALTKLYRELEYESGNALLEAYGYTISVSENKGGTPSAMSVEQVVAEFKERYKDGPAYSGLKELLEANADLAPYCKKAQNNANELFGMSFAKYLTLQGILAEKTKAGKPEQPAAKEPRKTAEEILEEILEELKKRYPEGSVLETSVSDLKKTNSDMRLSTLDSLAARVYQMTAKEMLISKGLISTDRFSRSSPVKDKCEAIIQILYDNYGGENARLNHVNNMSLPISNEDRKFLSDNAPKEYGMSMTKLLEARGVLYVPYRCPEGLRADVRLKTKLNGALASFKYNVDTTEVRKFIDLLHNNRKLTDSFGDPTRIPQVSTPESTAAYVDARKRIDKSVPKLKILSGAEGEQKLIAFIERCAIHTSPIAVSKCLEHLPRKADGSIALKRAAVIEWSEVCVEERFFELAIMAKSDSEIEMFIRSKKCDSQNLEKIPGELKNKVSSVPATTTSKLISKPENEKSLKMSLAEARKLFRVSITEDGVRLSKYKSEEAHVIIPSYVDNHPVTQVDFFATSQIKSIVLPETMTVIRSRSFQRCKNLEKVVLPKTIEKINDAAFAECEKLEDINIPTHTELNGHNIFTLCPNLADKNGMVIYNNTFYGYYGDKSGVEIPAEISTIGAYAFRAKENLKSVYIPDGVTYIGTSCFSGCAELKEIRVPESIEKIADWAFNGCYKLKTFNLPKGFVNIGSFALDGCYALSDDNGMVILNDCLYKYIPERQSGPLLKKVVVPEGVTRIANCAFEYSKFNVEVVLPSTIKTVGKSAFKGNIRLANINIPDGIEYIEGDAFYGCASLIDEKKLVIVNNILFDCFSDKKKVCVPDGVTRISEWAFLDKKSIETIILPQSVNRINSHAFNCCDNLQKVYLSENVETIEKEAFSFCPNLTLFVKSGSFSEQYAKENNIPFTAE